MRVVKLSELCGADLEKNVTQFVDLARTGRHQWWTYVLGLPIILASELGGIYVGTLLFEAWLTTYPSASRGAVSDATYFLVLLIITDKALFGHLAMLLFIFVVTRVLHQRPFRSLITANDRINWKYLVQGFGLYLLLYSAAILAGHFFWHPDRLVGIQLTDLPAHLYTLILAGITVSAMAVIAMAEEVLVRGYILQGLGLWTRNGALLALILGFLFMAAHLGQTEKNFLLLFELGVFYTIMTLKTNGLELAIGMHIAHNLVHLFCRVVPYQPLHLEVLFPICAVIIYLIVFFQKTIAQTETVANQR